MLHLSRCVGHCKSITFCGGQFFTIFYLFSLFFSIWKSSDQSGKTGSQYVFCSIIVKRRLGNFCMKLNCEDILAAWGRGGDGGCSGYKCGFQRRLEAVACSGGLEHHSCWLAPWLPPPWGSKTWEKTTEYEDACRYLDLSLPNSRFWKNPFHIFQSFWGSSIVFLRPFKFSDPWLYFWFNWSLLV